MISDNVGANSSVIATLVRIARVLNISTDQLLGLEAGHTAHSEEFALLQQQMAADVGSLDLDDLRLAASVVRTIVEHRLVWKKSGQGKLSRR